MQSKHDRNYRDKKPVINSFIEDMGYILMFKTIYSADKQFDAIYFHFSALFALSIF